MGDVPVTRVRSSLAALLLAGTGVVGVGALTDQALACPADTATIQSQTMAADDVFSGTVTDRRADGRTVTYDVAVERVYKGGVDTEDVSVTTDRAPRACGVPDLQRDSTYVFFTTGADHATNESAGTAPATDARVARVERLLGDGRTPTPPVPEEATFTVVAGEPTSLQRVAAPGLALVIVGVLGFGMAIGLSRRQH